MKQIKDQAWLDRVIDFVGEYTRSNPGYSSQGLTKKLQSRFFLSRGDANKIAGMVEEGLSLGEMGLGAIELNLTFNCNLTCDYCFVHRKSPTDRMSLATAQRSVDFLMERAGFPSLIITLIGGEPLLEFELIKKIVPYAIAEAAKRDKSINWAMTTNGTLLDEAKLDFLARNQINILLSLDGGPDTHDRYRRTKTGEGTWHRLASLIPLMKLYQPWLGARMTVSQEALDTMRDDFRQIVDLGINQMIIAPAQGEKMWSLKDIEKFGRNMMDIMEDYHALKSRGDQILIDDFEHDQGEYLGWGCRAGSTSLAVAPNGDLSPCSKLLGLTDEVGRAIVGNVHRGINEEVLRPFKYPINQQPGHCKSCSRKCSGGCYSVNFEQTGNHFLPSEENCYLWVVSQETKKASLKRKMQYSDCVACNGQHCESRQ